SRPIPTFLPGCMRVPTWRTRMFPARTRSPPNTLTPRRCPWLSLPLRELPPAFLCAIELNSFLCDFHDLQRSQLLPVAALAAVAFAPLFLKHHDLFALPLLENLGRHFDVAERRCADFNIPIAAEHQHVGQRDTVADRALKPLDADDIPRRDAVLLTAGPDNHVRHKNFP